ncbi:hypothetical protein DUNSADRAFT_6236 [Dunaliella salina]|uniref:Formyl transferase C-terminal domain-containing protein n=1 Tax=Dunaliella salina TaxID=3046 RepID=A0ABQ7GNP3_DUNSA|nr:hypothetical protein DUNSADRAFT_6236 [Dunaliella salina]|eukprot:KAF5836225.1 hypothetical protein DUNSADRAFT_6236 [Dunaliella salina]
MQRDQLLSVRHPKWTPCSSTLRLPRSCISTLRTALIFSHLHHLEVPLRCRAHALTLVDPNEQAPERTDWLSHCAALTSNSQIGCSTALFVRVLSQVDPNEQAPDLTDRLFRLGSKLLLQHLPSILSGKAMQAALPQPHDQATHAAKVTREDSYLDLSQPANSIHNVVRALAGWPGARAALLLEEHRKGTCVLQPMEIKVMRTRVLDRLPPPSHPPHVPRKQQSRAHPAACQSHGSSEHLSSKRSSEEHSSSSSSSSSSSNISSGSSSSSSSACRDSERWPHPPSPASDRDLFSMAPLGGREQQLPDSLPTLCSPGAASADSSKLVVRTNTQALETPCPPPRDGNSLQPQASQPPEVPPCVSPRPTADLGGTADAAGNGHSARLADGGNSDRPASSALAGGAAEAAGSRHSARLADGGNSDRPASSALAGGAAEAAGSGRSARLADGGNSDRLASSALAGGAAEAADGGNSDRLAVGGNSDRPASSALAGGAAEAADSGDSARLADGGNSDRLASSALAGGAAEAADGGNSDRLADGDNSDRQASSALPAGVVGLVEGCMIIPCGHGTLLEVVEVRHSAGQFGRGRGSSLSGREFMNGLARRRLLLPPRGTVPTSH